jgi:hypothetical protein
MGKTYKIVKEINAEINKDRLVNNAITGKKHEQFN